MKEKALLSMMIGQLLAALPFWTWDTYLEQLTGSFALGFLVFVLLLKLETVFEAIKMILASANTRTSKQI